MDSTAADKEIIASDPFAADIFAPQNTNEAVSQGAAAAQAEGAAGFAAGAAEAAGLAGARLWFDTLPRIPEAKVNWDELLLGLPPRFADGLARHLADALSRLLISPRQSSIEFLQLVKREIAAAEEFAFADSRWLTVGVEGGAEIAFEIDQVFSVWLVDAALGAAAHSDEPGVRELTPGETAVLEFLSSNLAHEANRFLGAPIFRFRSLSREIPGWLRRAAESETPSLLVANWQTVHGVLPSVVRIYLAKESLLALLPGENSLIGGGGGGSSLGSENLPPGVRDLPARLSVGGVELSYGELAALETSDIVLLDNHGFVFRDENLSGRAEVFLGADQTCVVAGEITDGVSGPFEKSGEDRAGGEHQTPVHRLSSSGFLRIKITNLAQAERKAPAPRAADKIMAETNGDLAGGLAEENSAGQEETTAIGGGGLAVENLAVNLRVELDARRLTLAEIANLRENQTIDLGVRPTEPVNLLIDNQIIGRGELVAVEDRLGVRVTKLLR